MTSRMIQKRSHEPPECDKIVNNSNRTIFKIKKKKTSSRKTTLHGSQIHFLNILIKIMQLHFF